MIYQGMGDIWTYVFQYGGLFIIAITLGFWIAKMIIKHFNDHDDDFPDGIGGDTPAG